MVRTSRGLDRLVNFSDATVAIAITLLLLPLVDVASEARSDRLGELFNAHGPTLLAFGVSFVVIARMWTMHHRLFEVVGAYSNALMRLNFLWLASIAFLPFASGLIAAAGKDTAANALYVGVIATSSLALALMEALVLRDPDLQLQATRDALHPTNSWLTFGTLVGCLILTLLVQGSGVWWLLLLMPAGWVSDLVVRRQQARRRVTAGAGS